MSSFSSRQQVTLLRAHIFQIKRDEQRVRLKLSSVQTKLEQSRTQIRDILQFMRQHQNGIDIHLQKLSKTESTIREQIDSLLYHHHHYESAPSQQQISLSSSPSTTMKHSNENASSASSSASSSSSSSSSSQSSADKQSKRAKKLNSNLIEIVKSRNDHESRLDSTQSTLRLMTALLSDESKPLSSSVSDNDSNDEHSHVLHELDDSIQPTVADYIALRRQLSGLQGELVECVKNRECAHQSLYCAKRHLRQQIGVKRHRSCICRHQDQVLLSHRAHGNEDEDDDDDDGGGDASDGAGDGYTVGDAALKAQLIQLGSDIHQRSGLIRQQQRDGACYLRVFVGSELITWLVKSRIAHTRYEALILSSLLMDAGYIYCVQRSRKDHGNSSSSTHRRNKPRARKKGASPAINLKKWATHSSNNLNNPNSHSHSAPSSVISIPSSSMSVISGISATSSQSVMSTSSTPSSTSSSSSSSSTSRYSAPSIAVLSSTSASTRVSTRASACHCKCAYCAQANKAVHLSSEDTDSLYRFRCDDARIERTSKSGSLQKWATFRWRKRHFVWDDTQRQIREYKSDAEEHETALCKYTVNQYTQVTSSSHKDECVFMIRFDDDGDTTLKLRAGSARERDSWLRVLKADPDPRLNASWMAADERKQQQQQPALEEQADAAATATAVVVIGDAYEEYRHLRMTNRLQWSSLFSALKATSPYIASFRSELLATENACAHDTERQLHELFSDTASPVCILFDSFQLLFLEPLRATNIAANHDLDVERVASIVGLCVDDLSSFVDICQTHLVKLLLPSWSWLKTNARRGKLVQRAIRELVCTQCFGGGVYDAVFALYRRVHRQVDARIAHVTKSALHLSTAHYQVSIELQIDAAAHSPFAPCVDKMREMTRCKSPWQKLQCLVELQQSIVQCIDTHRKEYTACENDDGEDYNNDDDNEYETKGESDELSIESIHDASPKQEKTRRTHGVMVDKEQDMNVSLLSYESSASEHWSETQTHTHAQPPQQQHKRKRKQLLIASDDMIPLFSFVLVQSQIASIHAEISFMNDFLPDDEKQMKTGFYLTTLQAATSALLTGKLLI